MEIFKVLSSPSIEKSWTVLDEASHTSYVVTEKVQSGVKGSESLTLFIYDGVAGTPVRRSYPPLTSGIKAFHDVPKEVLERLREACVGSIFRFPESDPWDKVLEGS